MNPSRLFLACMFLVGCEGTIATAPSSTQRLELRSAKAAAPGYTAIEIGTLPGDVESYAPSVNNHGHVIVSSTYFSSTEPRRARWFIRAGTQNFIFGHGGTLSDLSNGATTFVAVNASLDGNIIPALSTFDPSSGFSTLSVLDHSPGPHGSAQAVGDAGQVAGNTSNGGAVWNTDGSRVDVPNADPSTFATVLPRDINNTNDALFELHDNNLNHNRAYLRLSSGTLVVLPPLTGHVASRARELSEIVDGVVHVAGTSDDRRGNYRAVRWVVDASTGAIITTHVRPDRSSSSGIADDGTVVGDLSANGGTTPFVWRTNNTTVTLKAPKGLSSPTAWSISGNGRYISGQARSGSYGRAVYWVATP